MPRDPYDIRGLYVKPATPRRTDERVTDHRCGRCAYNGQGRADCPNRRPSQTVPYEDGPDV